MRSATASRDGRLPLQAWVATLVAAVTLPLGGLLVWNAQQAAAAAETVALRNVAIGARQLAAQTSRLVAETRAMLSRLATRSDIAALDPGLCAAQFVVLRDLLPRYANVLLLDRDSRVLCANVAPVHDPGVFRERGWFREAMAGAPYALGTPVRSESTRRWIVAVAVPVRAHDGQVGGVLAAVIDLADFPTALLADTGLPAGMDLAVVTQDGMTVALSRERERIGEPAPPVVQELQRRRPPASVLIADPSGAEHFAGIHAVDGVAWDAVALHPRSEVAASVRAALHETLAVGAGLLLAIWLGAAVAARRLLRPVRAIAAAAAAVGTGERTLRVAPAGPREIARIGENVNRMLDQREHDEAALRESEERFRALADSSPMLIWTADAAGRTSYVNATWLAFAGASAADAAAQDWLAGIHPDDAPAARTRWAEAYARHEGGTIEYRRRRGDGQWRWLLDSRAPRRAEDGRFLGFVGCAVDIHDRVVAEGRIRRLTALYAVLSQANEAIARGRDLGTVLQTVCDVVVRETGLANASIALADDAATTLRVAASAGEFADAMRRFVTAIAEQPPGQETPGSLAFRTDAPVVSNRRRDDPRVRPMDNAAGRAALGSSAVFPLHRGGRAAGVFALYAYAAEYFDAELVALLELLAEDVSFALASHADRARRDAAEEALRGLNATLEQRVAERTRSLEAANREMEAFSYSVSHDLRAPLRSIGGFSELLAEGYAERLDATGLAYLERVKAASKRMARLIDDLLDLSRISRQAIRRADIDLSRMAGEVIEDLRAAHPERPVQVTVEPGLRAHADPGLARIVLDNLLGNAWKFTARTAGASIAFASTTRDGAPAFVVRDNGAGFDLAYADKLFAPFQRLHNERDYPGSGIGLAIVQRIVHRHGGDVGVDAAPGEGASFTFTLGPPPGGDERQ